MPARFGAVPGLIPGFILLAMAGCTQQVERRVVHPAELETLDGSSPYLKAHLPDGRVYVLSDWARDPEGAAITGTGSLLDVNRREVRTGGLRVPVDSVALFETNVVERSGASTAVTVMAGVTAAVAGYCLINPKACFGSCPTFYVPGPDGELMLQAEGFSASIAPALEAADVDMLHGAAPASRDYRVRVTNEALETHVIRHADLLAVPRPAGGRVYRSSDGAFLEAWSSTFPSRCTGPEGDCLGPVRAVDGDERTSGADSANLATRELIELEFESAPAGQAGLVLVSRQSLMTTFLIYQALAYMGRDATRWLATLEQGGERAAEQASAMGRMLGTIDVLMETPTGDWVPVGSAGETGPIARETGMVPVGRLDGGPVRLRLRMTRGLWRLDSAYLVALGERLEPERIRPRTVTRDGSSDPAALEALLDPEQTLATLPGDAYDIGYRLPEAPETYELFLESRGYYLEWMRQEWLSEENPLKAAQMLFNPAAALRTLAPAFKEMEPEMEDLFWNSRYEPR